MPGRLAGNSCGHRFCRPFGALRLRGFWFHGLTPVATTCRRFATEFWFQGLTPVVAVSQLHPADAWRRRESLRLENASGYLSPDDFLAFESDFFESPLFDSFLESDFDSFAAFSPFLYESLR